MTKKDYILISSAIKDAKISLSYASVCLPETERSIEMVAEMLSANLYQQNPLFNREKFLLACGIKE